jgi:hypothetical protein
MIDTVVVAVVNGPIVRFILHTVAVSKHAKSQLAGAAALTGNGAGVVFGVDTELKEKPVLVVVGITEGVLRLMGVRLDVGTVDGMTGAGSWALLPTEEGDGELTAGEEDDATMGGRTEEGVAEDCAGGKPGGGPELGTEHGAVTVTAERMKTVSMPFVPVVVKIDGPPCTAGFVVVVNDGAGDGGVIVLPKLTLDDVVVVATVGVENEGEGDPGVLVGTIPPKLNVFGEGVEPN